LTSFDLSEHSDGFITILKRVATQNLVEMLLSSLEVAHLVVYLGEAKVSLVILGVVTQTSLVLLECLLVIALHVLNLAEYEVELTAKYLDLLSEVGELGPLRLLFALQDEETYLGKFLAVVVLLDQEVMIG
jgi:hypothetical protein